MPGKEFAMRSTAMISAYLDSKHEEALQREQGLDFMCTYGIGRGQKAVWRF